MACMQTHEVKKIRNGTEHREGERERELKLERGVRVSISGFLQKKEKRKKEKGKK